MSFPGFALGAGLAEEHKAQNAQKQDEERQAQLANIANAGLSPDQTKQAISELYAKDPSALKQHIQNLIGRVQGKQPQPTPMVDPAQSSQVGGDQQIGNASLPAPVVEYPGAKTHSEKLQQILAASGTTPQQRQQSLIESQGAQRVKEIEARPTLAPYKTYINGRGERQSFRVGEQPEGEDWQIAPPGGDKPLKPMTVTVGDSDEPVAASYDASTGQYVGQDGKPLPNAKPYVKEGSSTPYRDWKKLHPNADPIEFQRESAQARIDVSGLGSWQVSENADGQTVLFNGKTGEVKQAPPGLKKPGWFEKQVAPLQAASLNIDEYMNGGVFDGAGDLSLQHEFFTATQPATGFRMTKVQQDILQDSRSWMQSWKAKALHAATGQWFTDEQRKQIAKAAKDAIAAKQAVLQGGGETSPAPKVKDTEKKASGKGKGTVSLAKAKTLPQNKGKSDAEITADIKKSGYEVKP